MQAFLGRKDLTTVVHAPVTSRFDCCNVKLPCKNIWKVQLVKNAVDRMLIGDGCRDHVTSGLPSLLETPSADGGTFQELEEHGTMFVLVNGSDTVQCSIWSTLQWSSLCVLNGIFPGDQIS